jgi:hypothetical protein
MTIKKAGDNKESGRAMKDEGRFVTKACAVKLCKGGFV